MNTEASELSEGEPIQARLEPAESTLEELQSLIVQSRQLVEVTYTDLVCALSDAVAQLIVTRDHRFAIAIAAFALRIREEHL
jgi:hypothetical protein